MSVEIVGNVDVLKLQGSLHPDEINFITSFRDQGGVVVLTDLTNGFEAGKFQVIDGQPVLLLRIKNNTVKQKGVIIHEYCHFVQWRRGDLDFKDGKIYWKGVEQKESKNPIMYWNSPWEQEAYDVQANWLEEKGMVNSAKGFKAFSKGAIYGTHWMAVALIGLVCFLLASLGFYVAQNLTNANIITIINYVFVGLGVMFVASGCKLWKEQS